VTLAVLFVLFGAEALRQNFRLCPHGRLW